METTNRGSTLPEHTWFLEYAIGSVSNRNNLCELKQFPEVAKVNQGGEVYRSMFLYSPDIVDHVKEHGTVTGYNGIQGIDKIVIDIDYVKEDSGDEKTVAKVIDVIDKMSDLMIMEEHYNLWFSGTGFHVHLGNVYGFEPSNNLAKQVRATMQRDFGDYLDNIYDGRRLIRAGFSYHKNSRLYKIPISNNDIKNYHYETIAEMAMKMGGHFIPHKINQEKVDGLDPLDISRKDTKEFRKVFDTAKGNTSRYITCAQHIYNAGHVPKHRHQNLMRLISIWMNKYGHDKPACDNLSRAYMQRMDKPLPAEEVSKVVSDVFKGGYEYGCNDNILSEYCDSKCILYKYKDLGEESNVLNAEEMVASLVEYYTADITDRSFDLKDIFPFLPRSHHFTSGELVTLIGDTGLGKTAFFQYLVMQLTHIKTLFLSLEVDMYRMKRRLLQTGLRLNKEDVIKQIRSQDPEFIKRSEKCLEHIKLLDLKKRIPDISEFSEFLGEHDPKIVIVDTIDRVPAKWVKNDDLVRQEIIINKLKDVAMEKDLLILAIHHISKSAAAQLRESGQLNVHSGKGNSAIEQKSDQYLSFTGSNDSKSRIIRSLKARDESGFEMAVNFNWETFTFDKRN